MFLTASFLMAFLYIDLFGKAFGVNPEDPLTWDGIPFALLFALVATLISMQFLAQFLDLIPGLVARY